MQRREQWYRLQHNTCSLQDAHETVNFNLDPHPPHIPTKPTAVGMGDDESVVSMLEGAGFTGCSQELELPAGSSLNGVGSTSGMTYEAFVENYASAGKPFVDHNNALGAEHSVHRWQSRAAFLKDQGKRVAEIRWPSGANVVGVISRKSSVLNYVKSGMHHAEGGLLFDHVPAPDGLEVPQVFREALLNDTVLSVGAAGAGLPFHNHATAWQSVVYVYTFSNILAILPLEVFVL